MKLVFKPFLKIMSVRPGIWGFLRIPAANRFLAISTIVKVFALLCLLFFGHVVCNDPLRAGQEHFIRYC
jgi:hypothetical protein